jgi:ribonucleotide monophosphatase NagD (HAD superfamily)
MTEIPAIFCDIDGVVAKKFANPSWDDFGEPNQHMVRVLNTLGKDFTIIFITGRWAMGQEKVEAFLNNLFPDIKKKVFCKPHEYHGTTAEYKIAKVKELEQEGHTFYLALDDHSTVVGFMHNHGLFTAHVLSD